MNQAQKPGSRLLPQPTPETRHFWEGTRRGELLLQKCDACTHTYFPPQPFCPRCLSADIRVEPSRGRGKLHSYVISHQDGPGIPAPYSIAVVELEEGPRLMTNIVQCEQTPEALCLDMPVRVVFQSQNDEITLPFFAPSEKP